MAANHQSFDFDTKLEALGRQNFRCASCGARISISGKRLVSDEFGEEVHGHHMIPHKMGGPVTVDNCVVLCRSCHYSAHLGGHWRNIAFYDDFKYFPMKIKIKEVAKLYKYYGKNVSAK